MGIFSAQKLIAMSAPTANVSKAPKTETMLKKSSNSRSRNTLITRRLARHQITEKTRKAAKRLQALQKSTDASGVKKTKNAHFVRLETRYRSYVEKAKERTAAKRKAAESSQIFVEAEPKLILVVRIKGTNKIPHQARKTMQFLNLTKINTARFLPANRATIAMLKAAESYLTWGSPTFKTVQNLIYKRGFAKIRGQRLAISSNEIIARHLAQCNVICIEDLVHEIFNVTENFKQCNKFLDIFHLNSARKGIVAKRKNFANGGDAGAREIYINSLVNRMI